MNDMYRKYLICVITVLISVDFLSCNTNKKKDMENTVTKILKEWTGKKIEIPENIQCTVSGKDTVSCLCTELLNKEYKIFLYVDSTGCNDCKLSLSQWKRLMAEADSLFHDKLGFVFFFQPKSRKEMYYAFVKSDFVYPVFTDMDNRINQMNRFPEQQFFQCFLLNKNNEIMAIGNPALQPKIWELYKTHIDEKEISLN
jgi:hypothetical protein